MKPALLLSFLSGFVSLSYEILWYRAYSFATGSDARTFAFLLGAYLAGLAGGAYWGGRASGRLEPHGRAGGLRLLFLLLCVSTGFAYAAVPLLTVALTSGLPWIPSLLWIGFSTLTLGAVFPLVSHLWIAADKAAGRRLSYLYGASILGSAAGSLLTGFVLLDAWTFARISVMLALAGTAMAAAVIRPARLRRPAPAAAGISVAAAALLIAGERPYDALFEKLQLKTDYMPGYRFAHVVETRAGVITVDQEGRVYGGGIYDGAYNVSLRSPINLIIRPYFVHAMHPRPSEVLVIGLGSGSWAKVMADHPRVDKVTIVEINPGYAKLLPLYPQVSSLLRDPKVEILFDDARRWLVRNRGRRFDAIVANATFHWRASASNLLSVEFLELIRARLKPGGICLYNTTASPEVQKTGATVFPHALLVYGFLAVSDSPIRYDLEAWKRELAGNRVAGRPEFDLSRTEDRTLLEEIVQSLAANLVPRETVLQRAGDVRLVTDDNMGTEFLR